MEPADAGSDARRREQKLVADPNLTSVNCTGDDRAGAAKREAAVDRDAKATSRRARRNNPSRFEKPRFK
jgi:hypothetical protein